MKGKDKKEKDEETGDGERYFACIYGYMTKELNLLL